MTAIETSLFAGAVKNTGNVNDSYNLNVTNPENATTCGLGTALKMNLTTGILAPEGTMDITLYVANLTEGVFLVNVTVTSVNDSTKFDYVNTTTTVDGTSPTIFSVELDKYEVNQSESINITVNASDDTGIVNVTANGIPFSLTSGTATSGAWNGSITASSIVGTYNVSVVAKDAVDNTATNDTVQYNVSDVTAPEISNVAVSSITTSSATITWTTNEDSDSRVKYGTSSGVYTESKDDLSSTKSHSISLTGLSAGTTYYYVVNSTDLGGNSAESKEHSFKTESPYHPSGGGGSGGPPLDSDADGSLDIAEQLMGTDLYDPCDPYPNCAACVALKQPAATPEVTPGIPLSTPAIQTPAITSTPTPTPAKVTPTPEEPGFESVFAIAGLFAVAYLVRRKQ